MSSGMDAPASFEALRSRREHLPETTGIVFCSNDASDAEANRHANAIGRQLASLAPGLRVVVATAKVDSAKGQIDSWVRGGADVLIVKQMASLGLDAQRCKVVLDLSSTRTYSGMVQKIMRAATPWAGVKTMDWISPNDVLSEAVWVKLVQEEGGEAVGRDFELVEEYEKDRQDSPNPKPYVEGVGPAGFDDSEDNRAHADEWERTRKLVALFPPLLQTYSHAEISRRLLSFDDDAPAVVDAHAKADALRYEINALIGEVTNARQRERGSLYTQSTYGEMIQAVWKEAYMAGWQIGLKLDRTDDLALLERLLGVTRRILERHVG